MPEVLLLISEYFDASRFIVGAMLCLLGALLAIIGTVGVLRFPDFYTRLHAASVTDTSAALSLIVGMALMSEHWLVLVKLVVIWILLLFTGPTASHAVANAAHTAGLEPLIGPQKKQAEEER